MPLVLMEKLKVGALGAGGGAGSACLHGACTKATTGDVNPKPSFFHTKFLEKLQTTENKMLLDIGIRAPTESPRKNDIQIYQEMHEFCEDLQMCSGEAIKSVLLVI